MPCSAITNKAKLKSAIDNFDKILDEYKKQSHVPEKPRLKKAKTCSIIESKCILKKSLSSEDTLNQNRLKDKVEDSRSKSKSLYDINNEEALILANLTPVIKKPPKRFGDPVSKKSPVPNSKVKGVVNKWNSFQNADVRSSGTSKITNSEKVVEQTLKKTGSETITRKPKYTSKDARDPLEPSKPAKPTSKVLKPNFDFSERKNQIWSKFNQNSKPPVSLKRDLSLRQTDRDVAEVIASSNPTIIVKRSLIPKALSCQDVSQTKKSAKTSKIPVKNLGSQKVYPSTPTGLNLLVDRCSDVPPKGQVKHIFSVYQTKKTTDEKYPERPQAKPRVSLFGIKKHLVEAKYVENLPKPRPKVNRSDTYTKTDRNLEIKTAQAHQLLETKYHQTNELTLEVPVSKLAITLTEQVVETVVDLQTDEKGYASDDSGNISNDLDVEEGVALKYSSAESLSSSGEHPKDGPKIFLRSSTISQLESARDHRLHDTVVRLQAAARGLLARRRLNQLRLQAVAVRCIQRNVKKHQLVRHWPWWKLLLQLQPLLNVNRVEDELKAKTEELQTTKSKLEKIEADRNYLKLENDKLETRISEITADLADEHSAAAQASERLETETTDRIRLERELTEAQVRNERLERTGERLEMELLYARADLNGGGAGSSIVSEDGSSSVGGDDEEGGNGDGYYKERYQRAVRELQFTKRRLQQQHEDDLEQLVGLKKQLEKKLADAHEETSEQRAASAQWKRRVAKVTGELTDVKLLLEQQMSRNSLLEKKQRKFDAELQAGAEVLRSEKTVKDRLQRELDEARRHELELEGDLEEAKHELEVQTERIREADASSSMVSGSISEDETSQLRRLRVEHERRLQEQEQELDELAGQVQLLEAAKLRLEMALEQQRKVSKRDSAQHEEELEEARCHGQKKVKVLEQQLEAEQAERSNLIHQKREAERRLTALLERQREEAHREESASNRLRRDLKRTKALLRDAHAQLQSRNAGTDRHKAQVRQLRNQLDEAELGRASAVKAKSAALDEVAEKEAQLDEAARGRRDAEEGLSMLQREHQTNLARLEENEEELSSVLQRHRSALAGQTRDHQAALRDKESLISELESERSQLREQLHELNTRLEAALVGGAGVGVTAGILDGNMQRLVETRAREAETRLELEQTVRARLEVQVNRAKEAAERSAQEAHHARNNQQQAQEQLRKFQRTMREVREESAASVARESETAVKIREAETRAETATSEAEALRTDLRLALQRIDALQQAMSADLDDLDDNSNSDQDDNSDDDSSLDDLYLTTSKSASSNRLSKGASVASSASTMVGSSGSGSTITTLQNGNAVTR